MRMASAISMRASMAIRCPFCDEGFGVEIYRDGTVDYLHSNPDYPQTYKGGKNGKIQTLT